MPNIHAIGMSLTESSRKSFAEHIVQIQRIENGELTPEMVASSPPIGQILETETGLDLAYQYRVFYIAKSFFDVIGLPKINWIVIDRSDDSSWRIIPDSDNYAWQYHGQNKTSIKILTKGNQIAAT